VFACESRQFSSSIMSRSCLAPFPVCVFKFSSHYLFNIIFIDNSLRSLTRESPYSLINSSQSSRCFPKCESLSSCYAINTNNTQYICSTDSLCNSIVHFTSSAVAAPSMYLAHNQYQTHNLYSIATLLTPTTHNISAVPAVCVTALCTLPVQL
jgi:hypothetical protein